MFELPAKITLENTFRDQLNLINAIIDYLQNPKFTAGGSVMIFDDIIDFDLTIPPNKRALSINVTIADGHTVTVEPGASFVVL